MARIFVSLLLVVLLFWTDKQPVAAQQSAQTTEQLVALIRKSIQEEFGVPKQDVLIVWDDEALEKKLSQLDSGLFVTVNPDNLKRLIGQRFLLLDVMKGDTLYRKLNIKITVDVWVSGYQTTHTVQRGEPFTEGNVKKIRTRLSTLPKNFVTGADNIVSLVAERNLTSGQVLTDMMVKQLPVINKGDAIKILVVNGNLQLTAQGTALENANKNQMFRAKLLSFGGSKTIYVQAISSGLARLVVK